MPESLDELRQQICDIDLQLLELAARRLQLSRAAGEAKRAQQLPTVDYAQEKVVLDRARSAALELGLEPRVAEDLFANLIRAAVSAQDLDNQRHSAAGLGKTAVVIGGAGRMGRWITGFLRDQGYQAGSLDLASPDEENDWARTHLATADLIIASTPPTVTADLYHSWQDSPPAGIIADIASIKTPLLEPIRRLQQAGARVGSFHPMFGPSVRLLRDCDVVVCDTGDPEATEAVRSIFSPTTARMVEMPVGSHDRVMAEVLSLAHLTALAFALALPEQRTGVRSTTLAALDGLAHNIVRESADVYYEIQTENPHSAEALQRLQSALTELTRVINQRDPVGFSEILRRGRERT